MTTQTVAVRIASLVAAIENCQKSATVNPWEDKHKEALRKIVREYLPSGSGIDRGTWLDRDRSNPEKLVFVVEFHHMNEAGMYNGWTSHNIVVSASLVYGLRLTISGKNRNGIKDYLHEIYHAALSAVIGDAS